MDNPQTSGAEGPSRPERRRHRVYATRHLEYHLRDGICVAVRDSLARCFVHGHVAIESTLHGGMTLDGPSPMLTHEGEPLLGESLVLTQGARRIVTAPLRLIGRPPLDVVKRYPR